MQIPGRICDIYLLVALLGLSGCDDSTFTDDLLEDQGTNVQPDTDGQITPADLGPSPDLTVDVDPFAPPWPVCAETSGEAVVIADQGVDIIWFVDTSASMIEEIGWVQQNINAFAQYIGNQNIDYRVVMIGRPPFLLIFGICVPPPLGGPNCTDGPNYRHVKEEVSSSDGLIKVIETYSKYQGFLRAQTTKHFVAVTDDNSSQPATWFEGELAKLTNPGFAKGFVFHSIVSIGPDPNDGCATGASYGKVYEELSDNTGGSKFPICQTNWQQLFASLAQSVVKTTPPPCSYLLPAPPTGQQINPDQVMVTYEENGQQVLLDRVEDKTACGTLNAYYYDDNASPTELLFCPEACTAIGGGTIRIVFGCQQAVD